MIKIIKTSEINNSGIEDSKINEVKNRKREQKGKDVLNTNEDIVDISGKSELLTKLKKEIEDIPEIRTDKVNQLKEKIEKDEYKIDGEKIADKIIGDHIIDELV